MKHILTTILAVAACSAAVCQAGETERLFSIDDLPASVEIFDIDTDGVLSHEEVLAMEDFQDGIVAHRIDAFDLDLDGLFSAEERMDAHAQIQDRIYEVRSEHFDSADLDGDGLLDFSEFIDQPGVQDMYTVAPEDITDAFSEFFDDEGFVTITSFLEGIEGDDDSAGAEDENAAEAPEYGFEIPELLFEFDAETFLDGDDWTNFEFSLEGEHEGGEASDGDVVSIETVDGIVTVTFENGDVISFPEDEAPAIPGDMDPASEPTVEINDGIVTVTFENGDVITFPQGEGITDEVLTDIEIDGIFGEGDGFEEIINGGDFGEIEIGDDADSPTPVE